MLDLDNTTLGSLYYLPESITTIFVGNDDISATRFILPIYYTCLGKYYTIRAIDSSPASIKIRFQTNDKVVGAAAYGSDQDVTYDLTEYNDLALTFFATEDGWITYYQPPVFFVDADSGSYAITGTDAELRWFELDADSGTYTITGTSADLTES